MAPDLLQRVREALAPFVERFDLSHGMPVLTLAPGRLLETVRRLKEDLRFDLFLDVTAVDWPGEEQRFEVIYHFYSTQHRVRLRVKTRVAEGEPLVDSLVPLYGSAGYMERECHDMFGIGFRGNPDLRPVLLYEGFVGHPLRKDYPKDREQPLVPTRTREGQP